MSLFLTRKRAFSGLKGVKVVQMVIPSRWNSCEGDDVKGMILNYFSVLVFGCVSSFGSLLSDIVIANHD